MAEDIWIPDTRPILIKYDKLSASFIKMDEETWIPDTRPILLKYGKIKCKHKKNGGGDWNTKYTIHSS